ncbi:MAG: ribonucleoside-triphosphate reductase-like protein [Clostridiales bacterium]|jgi:pyruvate formate lyase activating enzyme|nr:ribonucleoside-triphosphate reductase-like protein [Clostridiales bacterium]
MIKGWHKLSLIDYPGHLCTTIFLGGCNFRCFYCHNSDIAFSPESSPDYSIEDILDYLEHRQNYIEGVCISGGEPTIYCGLINLIEQIKSKGFKVKLDTNGTRPEVLWDIIRYKLVDYIAMDIKAPRYKYCLLSGISKEYLDLDAIERSIEIVRKNRVDYEFRTTVIPEVLSMEDIILIGCWLSGSQKYVLQSYKGKYGCLAVDRLTQYAEMVSPHFQKVEVRA